VLSRQDFEKHWQALQERFRAPNGKLSLLVFNAVKTLNERQWGGLVDAVIGDAKTLPTVTEFKRMTLSYVINAEQTYPCDICHGAGITTFRVYVDFYDIAVRCTCLNGHKYPSIPSSVSKEYIDSVKAMYRKREEV
jgi:hypothetical protein